MNYEFLWIIYGIFLFQNVQMKNSIKNAIFFQNFRSFHMLAMILSSGPNFQRPSDGGTTLI